MSQQSLTIHLIKPSKYDDDGYVVHHVRGVLPSNTLAALNSLFRSALAALDIAPSLTIHDETVGLVKPSKVMQASSGQVLVCLVGVQTNQFPRAVDLAIEFKALGAMVAIGGFHVSGTISMLGVTEELRNLQERGVSLFVGEAEGRLKDFIGDALQGTLKPLYNGSYPDLAKVTDLPVPDESIASRFVLPFFGTIDCSRGCVFLCSFCTIINVQGKSIRSRDPAAIEAHIIKGYPRVRYYFFTDDNMARNPRWREIFDRLIDLRARGLDVRFMMQVDTLAYKIPDFAKLAAKAGCTQVFIGIESLNQANLEAASKKQNRVDRFESMSETWRDNGIAVHAAYIIGFPFDTTESVAHDVSVLINEVKPDQASFFMLTPLPGSADHRDMTQRGDWMSNDFNEYDSFHATAHHRNMSADEWRGAYRSAWQRFYSKENMIAILSRSTPEMYWQVFKNAAWHAYAIYCEGQHPMITGFWRLKGRTSRRASFPRESHVRYSMRRASDALVLGWRLCKLTVLMEHVWRNTWFKCRGRRISWSAWKPQNAHLNRLRGFAYLTRRATSAYFAFIGTERTRTERRNYKPILRTITAPLQFATKGWLFLLNFSLEV